jgi:bifunctional UDP-N-acetylglucosamine pyrophosphorylase/glucosamine-1-phosphate N-acetyltransferase
MKVAAIVLAAGKGTRMKSRAPKALHPLSGQPMVSFPVEAARAAGADEVVVVVGHQAEQVEAALRGPGIRFALQAEQRGTGHAAAIGLASVSDDVDRVWVLNGDVPLLRPETLLELRRQTGDRALGAVTMRVADPTGYGRLVRDAAGAPQRIVEHRDADPEVRRIDEVNAGVYDADRRWFARALGELSDDNDQGELYITDTLATAAAEGGAQAWTLPDPDEVLGVNTRAELAHRQQLLWRRTAARLQEAGVTILQPETVTIDPWVQVGAETILHPRVALRGRTVVGEDCVVDVGAVLTDATVADGVHVHPYTVVERGDIGPRSVLGPFARVRPGTRLGEGAKIGNFVETKNTRLGDGAKANHLTYLGDADVGAGANVGAGTITCNYDGFGKYPTRIGAGSFVGSNATLVAPLSLGEDSYVAAGSTVTDDAEAEALVFGRARQVTKDGRARAVRDDARERAGKKGS